MILRRLLGCKGWTLLELMIALSIMGIVSSFVIPGYLRGMPLRRLKADAMDITSNMKYAKMKAVQRNMQVGLYFNDGETAVNGVDPGFFCVYEDTGATANRFDSADAVLKDNIALRGGVQFDSDSWTIKNSTIVFRPNGSASKSGTVIISNGSETRRIIVHAISGRVRIE
jgi:prepilin-type N-terminal cleavage/methylation domain-containing protein